jgi:hypothetical protein
VKHLIVLYINPKNTCSHSKLNQHIVLGSNNKNTDVCNKSFKNQADILKPRKLALDMLLYLAFSFF